MSHRPVIDAGPGLNFFSTNQERLLIATLGPLCLPETVRDEMVRKARQDNRFRSAETVLNKLPGRLMEILSDDVTDALSVVILRLTRQGESGFPTGLPCATSTDDCAVLTTVYRQSALHVSCRQTAGPDD